MHAAGMRRTWTGVGSVMPSVEHVVSKCSPSPSFLNVVVAGTASAVAAPSASGSVTSAAAGWLASSTLAFLGESGCLSVLLRFFLTREDEKSATSGAASSMLAAGSPWGP